MANDKIIEFPEEGVTVKIPKVHKGVFVEKKPWYDPPRTKVFKPIRVVINIGFFVIDKNTKKKKNKKNLVPKAKLRIRYKQSDMNTAKKRKKPLKLAWWDGSGWNPLPCVKTSSTFKKWAGFGDTDTSGWDDPPIAWGT